MNVLYLSYTGLMEPLGRSQVLAYLIRLSRQHKITLITFEKPADLEDEAGMAPLRARCAELGITWFPLRYHHRPRVPATALDLANLALHVAWLCRGRRIDIVHCRGYIPTMVAYAMQPLTRVPFIFDMRALWPEEMVAAGSLKSGTPLHSGIKLAERLMLKSARSVVSLTSAAATHLKASKHYADVDFHVIPTCVDLERFSLSRTAPGPERSHFVLGSIGTIASGWFLTGWLMAFFVALAKESAGARLLVVSRDPPERVLAAAAAAQVASADVTLRSCTPEEVPTEMAGIDAGVFFFTTGVAKLGSAPTRMGEFLACGIPVVGNRGVGDVAELIERFDVGVVVDDDRPETLQAAARRLLVLKQDPGLPARCRRAAEEYFSVDRGSAAYDSIYRKKSSTATRRLEDRA